MGIRIVEERQFLNLLTGSFNTIIYWMILTNFKIIFRFEFFKDMRKIKDKKVVDRYF